MTADKESRLTEMLGKSNGRVKVKEERVLRYLLENEDRIQELSITEIAKNADVSKATVVRFCKSLDFNGLKDFKVFYEAGKGLKYNNVQLVSGSDSPSVIASSMKDGIGRSLERTFTEDNIAMLGKIADEIKKNEDITLIGFDDEYSYAERLKKIIEEKYPSKKVSLNSDEEKKAPCTIIFSFSGNDKRDMDFLTNAVLEGGSAYAFTSSSSSLVARAATGALILSDDVIYSSDRFMLTKITLSALISALEIML